MFVTKVAWSCNRIVVSTSRCGRDNPGSNPGYSTFCKSLLFIKGYNLNLLIESVAKLKLVLKMLTPG